MYSVPFALLCGGIGYLLFGPSGRDLAIFGGLAVLTGCLVHLVLHEFSAFGLKFGFLLLPKRSRGTGFKFKSQSIKATLFVYLMLILVGIAIFMLSAYNYLHI